MLTATQITIVNECIRWLFFGHGLRKQSQLLPSEQQIEKYTTVKETYTRNGEIQL